MADGNNLEELRELVDFLKANGIAEFEMDRAEWKVRIKFEGAAAPAAPGGLTPAQLALLMGGGGFPGQFATGGAPVTTAAAGATSAAAAAAPEEEEKLHE